MYPSDSTPRRRMQAVPNMSQMIRRRAASPQGVLRNGGAPVLGMPKNGHNVQPVNIPQGGSFPGPRPLGPDTGHNTQPVNLPPPSPNQFLGPGDQRDPRAHLAWWAQNGWNFNAQTGRFHYVGNGQGGQPGGPGGGQPGQGNGGNGGNNGGNGNGNGDNGKPSDQLPLDATFEAQRRAYEDALAAQMGVLGPMREQVGANLGLQGARLDTNQNQDQRSMLESLAGRGAFGGGIQTRDTGNLATNYLRQHQDLANSAAGQYSDIAQRGADAQTQYQQSLAEALLALAQRQAQSQYSVTRH